MAADKPGHDLQLLPLPSSVPAASNMAEGAAGSTNLQPSASPVLAHVTPTAASLADILQPSFTHIKIGYVLADWSTLLGAVDT